MVNKEWRDSFHLFVWTSDYLENPGKKEEVKKYENQIDQLVYKPYGLTPEEIGIVEG